MINFTQETDVNRTVSGCCLSSAVAILTMQIMNKIRELCLQCLTLLWTYE